MQHIFGVRTKNTFHGTLPNFFLLYFAVSSSIPVVSFQKDGLFSERTFMQFKGNAIDSEIEDFTLCMRIKLFRLRGSFNSIFSYAIPQMDNEINVGKIFKLFTVMPGKNLGKICPFFQGPTFRFSQD